MKTSFGKGLCLVVCLMLLWLVSACNTGGGSCGQPFCLGKYADSGETVVYEFFEDGKLTATLAGVTFQGNYHLEGNKVILWLENRFTQEGCWSEGKLWISVGEEYPPYELTWVEPSCQTTDCRESSVCSSKVQKN